MTIEKYLFQPGDLITSNRPRGYTPRLISPGVGFLQQFLVLSRVLPQEEDDQNEGSLTTHFIDYVLMDSSGQIIVYRNFHRHLWRMHLISEPATS